MKTKVSQEEIRSVYKDTNSYTETGLILDISKQRVHQIITGYRSNTPRRSNRVILRYLLSLKLKCAICNYRNFTDIKCKDGNEANVKVSNLIHVCKECKEK